MRPSQKEVDVEEKEEEKQEKKNPRVKQYLPKPLVLEDKYKSGKNHNMNESFFT